MTGLQDIVGEGLLAVVAAVGLGGLVGLGELLRWGGISARATRRLVHAGVSLFVASTPLVFGRPLPVYGLAGLFVVLNTAARLQHWWPGLHAARPASWGTVALPLSVLPALAATWTVSPDRILAFQAAYLVLAVADPAASWVGEEKGAAPQEGAATIPGSLAFAAVTLVLMVGLLTLRGPGATSRVWGAAGAITLVATVSEAVSSRGWDNLFVVAAVVLVLVPLQTGRLLLFQFGGALLTGVGFGGLAYWARALDGRGAVTGGLFAASIVGLGGWAWIVPGIVFFGLSSALTKLNDPQAGPSLRRTQRQVLANGGVAWTALAVVAVAPLGASTIQDLGYAAFVGALSAAAADTWATELGGELASAPWSLRTGRRVPSGTSGAVSILGTGGALLGAASVVGTALWVNGAISGVQGLILLGAGMVGMLADSLAGAFLQAQYREPSSDDWVETPPRPNADPDRGWTFVGNDAVNFIGTLTGALVALAGVMLVG